MDLSGLAKITRTEIYNAKYDLEIVKKLSINTEMTKYHEEDFQTWK